LAKPKGVSFLSLVTKADVTNQVKIFDIAKQFGIRLESASAGNFDYRCRCMSSEHKSGRERSASLYIDSIDNNFHCFGCNEGGSVIGFYMLCSGKEFGDAFRDLKEMVRVPGKYQDVVDQKKIVFPLLLESSNIIRRFLIQHPDQLDKMTGLLKKIDKLSFDTAKEDPDKIFEMNNKLRALLEEK